MKNRSIIAIVAAMLVAIVAIVLAILAQSSANIKTRTLAEAEIMASQTVSALSASQSTA